MQMAFYEYILNGFKVTGVTWFCGGLRSEGNKSRSIYISKSSLLYADLQIREQARVYD